MSKKSGGTAVLSAKEVFADIQDYAEKIASNKPQRFPEAASDGDYFRQGDIYITFREGLFTAKTTGRGKNKTTVTVPHSDWKEVEVSKLRLQLAIGDTQGARHVLDNLAGVRQFEKTGGDALQGLLLLTTEERVLTHPEHGHTILPASVSTCDGKVAYDAYEFTFQRMMAQELARVHD